MAPAYKLKCKDQMKYYLNTKKLRLMCYTARELAWGQTFLVNYWDAFHCQL